MKEAGARHRRASVGATVGVTLVASRYPLEQVAVDVDADRRERQNDSRFF